MISKPSKTNTHIEDRKWLANFVANWTEEDFLHITPSDEFYICVIREPNPQNDRIWAKNISTTSAMMKGTVKWLRMQDASELCRVYCKETSLGPEGRWKILRWHLLS